MQSRPRVCLNVDSLAFRLQTLEAGTLWGLKGSGLPNPAPRHPKQRLVLAFGGISLLQPKPENVNPDRNTKPNALKSTASSPHLSLSHKLRSSPRPSMPELELLRRTRRMRATRLRRPFAAFLGFKV